MRIALFAWGPVGASVAELLSQRGAAPALLVTDEADADSARIQGSFGHQTEMLPWGGDTESRDVAECLRALEIDLGLLAWWPRIIKPDVVEAARLGLMNLHPSLLPHCRGKDPNFWAIVEGAPFGVTLHFVDTGIDTGPVAFQTELPVTWEDNGESLYRRAQEAAVTLVETNLDRILAGDFRQRPQDLAEGSFHTRSQLDSASRLSLDEPTTARHVLDILRARTFAGHPAVRFEDEGAEYEARIEIRRLR